MNWSKSDRATASLVVGVVAVVLTLSFGMPWWVDCLVGAVAIYLAAGALRGGTANPSSRGQAVAGMVCGVIAVAFAGISVLCVCAGLALGTFGALALL